MFRELTGSTFPPRQVFHLFHSSPPQRYRPVGNIQHYHPSTRYIHCKVEMKKGFMFIQMDNNIKALISSLKSAMAAKK